MLIGDVLKTKSRPVITLGPEATVAQAIALLVEHNIGSMPVVDSGGRLVGIFTERDVLRGVDRDGDRFGRSRLGDVMTRDAITCDAASNVHDAMGKMSEHQIGQLPVLSGERVVGVVSVGDVVKLLYEQLDTENKHLLEYLYGPA